MFFKKSYFSALAIALPLFVANHSAMASNSPDVTIQSGDVTHHSAVVWARCNNETDSVLKVSIMKHGKAIHAHDEGHDEHERHKTAKHRALKTKATSITDYTGEVIINGLRPDTHYSYKASCISMQDETISYAKGSFKTASKPGKKDEVKFVWGADLGGQGWGQNPELEINHVDGSSIKGGYVVFDSMKKLAPDFALFQGDMIYADGAIPASKAIPADVGGGTWINSPDKDFVAITLDDYRANWKYNLQDTKLRDFLEHTPIYVQWDDHEVANNWYPGEIMPAGAPFYGIAANDLAANSKQALFEYNPIAGSKLYRSVQHGKHMELFLLDERTYRDANPNNYNPNGIEMLGQEQLAWLKSTLKHSTATWKIISTHDPVGIVTGSVTDRDSWGQNEAEVLGREVQLADILKFIKDENIKNVVLLTADVHFTAAISYEPSRATVEDFTPFWEFVIGPIHAGAFGPGDLDPSFGPQYEYVRAPGTEGIGQNSPPPHLQSFGVVEIDEDGEMTVQLVDITGAVLFEKLMMPE